MKKTLAILLMLAMSITLLAGCSNPVYDDLSNYLNVEMKDINADYEKITSEVGTWTNITDDTVLAKRITDVIIPLVNGSLSKLENVNPATEEVKGIKAKYVKTMETYKEGFEGLLKGCETQDEAVIGAANEKLNEAIELLNEYNAALEALAKEFGAEIEY